MKYLWLIFVLMGLPFGATGQTATQNSGHQVQAPLACPDSSGSGTAQSCNTGGPAYTPISGDCIIYTTTTTNSGAGLTVNVNSWGAKSVAIPGGSGWTTTLTANIIPANKPIQACTDGTNWNVTQTGTASSGGCSNNCTIGTGATGTVALTVNGFSSGGTANPFQVWNYNGGSKLFYVDASLGPFSTYVNATNALSLGSAGVGGSIIPGGMVYGYFITGNGIYVNAQAYAGATSVPVQMSFGNKMYFGGGGTTTTGNWTGLQIGTQFGNGIADVYNSSTSPAVAFKLTPSINVSTSSTTGYTEIWSQPTETSVGTGLTNYFILHKNAAGAITYSVTEGGLESMVGNQSIGTKFTTSGCSVSSTTGGATAGKMTLGAATCSVTITMNGATGLTATNGWSCHANDETTAAGNTSLYFSSNSTTTAVLSVPATAGSTDVIDFACTAF